MSDWVHRKNKKFVFSFSFVTVVSYKLNCSLLKCSVARDLRRDTIGLWEGSRARRRTLSKHQAWSENRPTVFFLLMSGFSSFAFFVIFLELLDGDGLLSHHVDKIWHCKVVQAVTPWNFQDNIWTNDIIAWVQHAHVAFTAANINKLFER